MALLAVLLLAKYTIGQWCPPGIARLSVRVPTWPAITATRGVSRLFLRP
jgi:hypothetical protein